MTGAVKPRITWVYVFYVEGGRLHVLRGRHLLEFAALATAEELRLVEPIFKLRCKITKSLI